MKKPQKTKGLTAGLFDFPLPVALADRNGQILEKNPTWVNLDPYEQVPFVWPLDFMTRIEECLSMQRPVVIRSVPRRTDGNPFDLWMSAVGEDDPRVWLVAADISIYRHDAVSQLIDAEVENASVMIQGILHEMRNPLAGIRAGLQLMQKRYSDPKLVTEIDEVLGDVARIDKVFQELVALGGTLNLHRRPENLHRVIDEAVATAQRAAAQRQVTIERHFDPSLPEIFIDPDRMYRVYLNLLINAVQASPEGGRVVVTTGFQRLRWTQGGGEQKQLKRAAWITRISDSGQGLDADRAAKLFTPLYTTKSAGTGLGLPISLQIVQAHGGMLTLQNRPEGGAEATVILPLD